MGANRQDQGQGQQDQGQGQQQGQQQQQQQQQGQQQDQQQPQAPTGTPSGTTGGTGQELEIGSVQGIVEAIMSPDFLADPPAGAEGEYVHKDTVNQIITERLNSEREQRRQEAERQALEKNQEFKTLYEQEKAEREKLAARATRADTYEELFNQTLTNLKQGVPPYVTTLLEAKDPVEQLKWLQQHRAAVVAPGTPDSTVPATPGAAPTEQPTAPGAGVQPIPATATADQNQPVRVGRKHMDEKYKDAGPRRGQS